jgi:DNA-binding LacI/PurR family transcriptional regulator
MHGRQMPKIAAIDVDQFSFVDRALDYLAKRNRRNVAVILGSQRLDYREYLSAALRKRRMNTPDFWLQRINPDMGDASKNLVHLLMRNTNGERPDGVVIADDNLVEHATAGLVAAGVNVPQDADVVVHCNFPWPTPSVLPVKRLGYDISHLIRSSINLIDRQRRGQKVPNLTMLKAMFEEEVTATNLALQEQLR